MNAAADVVESYRWRDTALRPEPLAMSCAEAVETMHEPPAELINPIDLPVPTVQVAKDGTILAVGQAFTATFGYTADVLVGRKVEQLVPEGIRGKHVQFRTEYWKHPRRRFMALPCSGVTLRDGRGKLVPVRIALAPSDGSVYAMVVPLKRLHPWYRSGALWTNLVVLIVGLGMQLLGIVPETANLLIGAGAAGLVATTASRRRQEEQAD